MIISGGNFDSAGLHAVGSTHTYTFAKDYLYHLGSLAATFEPGSVTRYTFADHLGSPRLITTGTTGERHDYQPFGREITGQGVMGLRASFEAAGVGTLVLAANTVLLAGYTLGCHSLRHLVGGRKDCMSCGRNSITYGTWKKVSWLNGRHMQLAWASLLWVMVTDLYVRLVSMGVISDPNTWSGS